MDNETENNEIKDYLSKLEEISKKFSEIDKKYKEYKTANQTLFGSIYKGFVGSTAKDGYQQFTDLKEKLDSFIKTEKEFTNQLNDQSLSAKEKTSVTMKSMQGVNVLKNSFEDSKFDENFTKRLNDMNNKNSSITQKSLKELCDSVINSCDSIKQKRTASFKDLNNSIQKENTIKKVKNQGGQNIFNR
jgi:hypothetical protein